MHMQCTSSKKYQMMKGRSRSRFREEFFPRTFVKKQLLREKLTVLRPSPGLPRECAGARRTAHTEQRTAHQARRTSKKHHPTTSRTCYVRIDTNKFKGLQLILGNGRRQLAIGVRLIHTYIHIYIHTYIHTYKHTCTSMKTYTMYVSM